MSRSASHWAETQAFAKKMAISGGETWWTLCRVLVELNGNIVFQRYPIVFHGGPWDFMMINFIYLYIYIWIYLAILAIGRYEPNITLTSYLLQRI